MKRLGSFKDRTELVLAALLVLSTVLVTPRIAESDAVQYFSYLPSLLMDGDLDFADEYEYFYREDPEGRQSFKETFLERETPTGLKFNFGPIGSAVLWSPFYITVHGVVLVAGTLGADVAADGLDLPYRWAVALASAIYAALGLLLSYRFARRYASEGASLAVVIALWWATPVAYYMYIAPGMSHATSLFAVALFFSLWPWVTSGGAGRWAAWGAAAGLMALVREQDSLFALAALVVLLSPRLKMDGRGRLLRLGVFGLTALLVFLPQLMVYQVLYGRPAPSSVIQNKLSWSSPHFFSVLFSPQHGLFFWSPVLLLFAIGGALLFRREIEAALLLALGFLSQAYVAGAYGSWTQAGAFGSRRFVAATVIFAVWGVLVLQWLLPRIRRGGLAAVTVIFILWNVSLMVQFGLGLMDRQKLVWKEIAYNHLYEVPPRLFSVVGRYFSDRDQLPGNGQP
ncbi:MAG: glycosyltransferase family 39 protein [Acidobacteriota bacterium]